MTNLSIHTKSKPGKLVPPKDDRFVELPAPDTHTLIGRVFIRYLSGDTVPREEVVIHSSVRFFTRKEWSH